MQACASFLQACSKLVIPSTTLKLAYYKLVTSLHFCLGLPYFNYCSIVWSRACKTNVTPLFLKQKQIIRIIGKAGKYEHTSILFRDFKILKLFDLFYLNDSVFMYLAYANELPYELQKYSK